MRLCALIIMATGLATLPACSRAPDSESAVQSLDSLVAGREGDSKRCRAATNDASEPPVMAALRFEQSLPTGRRKLLEAAVRSSVRAVPVEWQRLLVLLGGDIRVTSRTSEICATAHDVRSCFVAMGRYGKPQSHLSIVLNADVDAIQTSVVRAFGYFVAQYASRLYVTKAGNLQLRGQVSAELAATLTSMTDAFVSDAGLTDWRTEDDSLTRAGVVYAEAFDSWHCSATTRNRMKAAYPRVTAAFAPLDRILTTHIGRYLAATATPRRAATRSGFALADADSESWSPFYYPLLEPDASAPPAATAVPTAPSSPANPNQITVTIVDEAGTLDADDITVANPTSEDVEISIVPGSTPPSAGDVVVTTGGTQPAVPQGTGTGPVDTTTSTPPTTAAQPEPPALPDPGSGTLSFETLPPPETFEPVPDQPLPDGGTFADPGLVPWDGSDAFFGC